MSKIVKGIIKHTKKSIKSSNKIFKKVAKSAIGKIILAAIVIYTGGVLLGAWGATGPMSGMFGAWGGTTATAGATTGATAGATAATAAETAAVVEGAAAAGGGLSTAVETAAVLEGAGAAAPGLLSQAGTWMAANPIPTAMAMKGASAALSPDQEDMMREQERIRRERFASLSGVGDIDIGMRASGTPVTSMSGVPWHERLKRG